MIGSPPTLSHNWGAFVPGRGAGGPGHAYANAYNTPQQYYGGPGTVMRDLNLGVAPAPHKPARAAGNPYLDMAKSLIGAFSKMNGQGGGGLDHIRSHIGPMMSANPIQEFLPQHLTQQTQNDILARGAQQFAPQRMLAHQVGARGIDPSSAMASAAVARKGALGRSQMAMGAAETGLNDELQRYKFNSGHSLAAGADVLQGARNQAMRDSIWQRGQGQQQNFLLGLLSSLG